MHLEGAIFFITTKIGEKFDLMITQQHTQEGMSRSYIHAVTSSAKMNVEFGRAFDYGFDGTFRPVKFRNTRRIETGFAIDFQLKCTKNWEFEDNNVSYNLESKTYNDLVTRDKDALPAYLILMCVPDDDAHWVFVDESNLILRNCCYYTKLSGEPVPNEKSTKKILIPRANLLNPQSLHVIVDYERELRSHGENDA